MSKIRISNWYGIDVCIRCQRRLDDSEMMHRGGVCPKCGYNSNSTVCNTYKVVLREYKHYSWWEFWKNKRTYEGENEFSKEWLAKLKQ